MTSLATSSQNSSLFLIDWLNVSKYLFIIFINKTIGLIDKQIKYKSYIKLIIGHKIYY